MPAIQPINALPASCSPEEYDSIVASTPDSFSDIPPVLRHKEENVTVVIEPPLSPEFSVDDLKGTLYVLTSVLVFMSTSGRGFQVEYPSITLHAVSRAETGPCIYCQLDESTPGQSTEGEDTNMSEFSIIPANPGSLEAIFEALSSCASLHPDKEDEENELDDDAFIDPNTNFEVFNGDENEELSEVGRAALAYLESVIYNPFEDAEAQEASPAAPAKEGEGLNDTEHKAES